MIFDGHLCKKNRPSSHWRVIHRSCLLAIYQAEITPLDNDRNPGTPIGQSVLRGGRCVWMLLSWWFSFSYFHVFSYHLSMASLPSFAFLDLVKGKIMQKPWSFVAKKKIGFQWTCPWFQHFSGSSHCQVSWFCGLMAPWCLWQDSSNVLINGMSLKDWNF